MDHCGRLQCWGCPAVGEPVLIVVCSRDHLLQWRSHWLASPIPILAYATPERCRALIWQWLARAMRGCAWIVLSRVIYTVAANVCFCHSSFAPSPDLLRGDGGKEP